MTIKQTEEEAMRISALCQQGVHPRKHDKKQEAKKEIYLKGSKATNIRNCNQRICK